MERVVHSDYCRNRTAASEAYRAKWPKHCRSCSGTGHVDASDPSVGLFNAYDDCPNCVEAGVCGRCGSTDVARYFHPDGDPGAVCRVCGWTPGDYGDPGSDCDCYDQPDPDAWFHEMTPLHP